MGAKYYLFHPVLTIRKIFYFIIGTTFGRIFYPSIIFKSRWFDKITEKGWEWVTRGIFNQKIRGINSAIPWPVSPCQNVGGPHNISFHPDDLNNFQMVGSYFQGIGEIEIGRGTYIAQNVGLITANHNIENLDEHLPAKSIKIGEQCWIGMNSVILPGVVLGTRTIVGAGSIVTKSFPIGHCIIAGNPAKIIKEL